MHQAVEQAIGQRLGPLEADAFLARLDLLAADIAEPLAQVYGDLDRRGHAGHDCVLDVLDAAVARAPALRRLDRRREIDPAWFQRART